MRIISFRFHFRIHASLVRAYGVTHVGYRVVMHALRDMMQRNERSRIVGSRLVPFIKVDTKIKRKPKNGNIGV